MLDTKNPFVQLVSGVVWLIRNGSVYINESQAVECDDTQETGVCVSQEYVRGGCWPAEWASRARSLAFYVVSRAQSLPGITPAAPFRFLQ